MDEFFNEVRATPDEALKPTEQLSDDLAAAAASIGELNVAVEHGLSTSSQVLSNPRTRFHRVDEVADNNQAASQKKYAIEAYFNGLLNQSDSMYTIPLHADHIVGEWNGNYAMYVIEHLREGYSEVDAVDPEHDIAFDLTRGNDTYEYVAHKIRSDGLSGEAGFWAKIESSDPYEFVEQDWDGASSTFTTKINGRSGFCIEANGVTKLPYPFIAWVKQVAANELGYDNQFVFHAVMDRNSEGSIGASGNQTYADSETWDREEQGTEKGVVVKHSRMAYDASTYTFKIFEREHHHDLMGNLIKVTAETETTALVASEVDAITALTADGCGLTATTQTLRVIHEGAESSSSISLDCATDSRNELCCPCEVDELPETVCLIKYTECNVTDGEGNCRKCYTVEECTEHDLGCCDYGVVVYDNDADAWKANNGWLESTGCSAGPAGDYYDDDNNLVARVAEGECSGTGAVALAATVDGDDFSCATGLASGLCCSGVVDPLECPPSDCSGVTCP